MDCERASVGRSAFALTWRAALIGLLAWAVSYLLTEAHLYATALVLMGVMLLIAADVRQVLRRMERGAEHELRLLISGEADARLDLLSHPALSQSFAERATSALRAARSARQEQIEYLQTLLDTVGAALFVMDASQCAHAVNRAAHALAARPVSELRDIAALGSAAAERIQRMLPGARDVVRLRDGTRTFVSVARFATPTYGPVRLIALQPVANRLDAVEVAAWNDMARVLAHEIMNSLTPIASLSESAELLARSGHPGSERGEAADRRAAVHPEVLASLEAIARRSRGLIEFVERYRAVAELPQPRFEDIAARKFLDHLARLLEPDLLAGNISLRISLSPADLTLRADPQLLEHALINLLRNAIEAEQGCAGARIELSVNANRTGVRLSVADNGSGIAAEIRDEVFVPFFTTKRNGHGIGLTLVRQIAMAHGGLLELRDNEPKGTLVTLVLPLRERQAASSEDADRADHPNHPSFSGPPRLGPTSPGEERIAVFAKRDAL